jgi:hypothetical protein
MNLKSGAVQQFEQFSQFISLTEFHHHMEMWLVNYKQDFSKGELVGFKQLVFFTTEIPGVSHAKIKTILNTIHTQYHDQEISRDTFKRMLGKAKRLGILTIYEMQRENGSQDCNVYVFNRYPRSKKAMYSKN